MARTRRVKRDGDAHYHVMSRTNDRRFLFERGRVKAEMVGILRRVADFSGVRLEAFCMMDDHFHVVCRVSKGPVPEDELIRRIGVLRGGRFAAELVERWSGMRALGLGAAVAEAQDAWRRRMNDVSEFAKTFKEAVNIAYKAAHREPKPYCGSLWSGRFKSTLVEGGRHLAVCVRYVELNPVRAGMVARAKDYAYSSANDERPRGTAAVEGSVPEEELLRRMPQVGGGVIFGGLEFVSRAIVSFGWCWSGRPAARPAGKGSWASHGWRGVG